MAGKRMNTIILFITIPLAVAVTNVMMIIICYYTVTVDISRDTVFFSCEFCLLLLFFFLFLGFFFFFFLVVVLLLLLLLFATG